MVGLRVLEFGQIAAGPFAGMLLADLGADVVKVEAPERGDGLRDWPPLVRNHDGEVFSGNFASLNRNKRSIVADLKDPEQLGRVRQLCERADIVVENFRPGVMGRLGLGYEELRQTNADLIYCSISGYGQDGPLAQRGAFDVTIQAISGVMSCTGEEDGPPVKVGVPIGDFVAGLYGAFTILAAWRRGTGAYIDCSMLGSLLGIAALQTSEYFGAGVPAGRLGSAHPRNAPYQAFPGKDRHFVVAAGNEKLWRGLCEAAGRPELADDPRFATQLLRAKNQRELAQILTPLFAERPAHKWLDEFDRRGIACAPINTFAEILNDPHVAHMGLVTEMVLGNGVTTETVKFPISITDFEFEIFLRPPRLGEHTEEVFEEWLA